MTCSSSLGEKERTPLIESLAIEAMLNGLQKHIQVIDESENTTRAEGKNTPYKENRIAAHVPPS